MANGWASNDGSAQFPDGTTQGSTASRYCFKCGYLHGDTFACPVGETPMTNHCLHTAVTFTKLDASGRPNWHCGNCQRTFLPSGDQAIERELVLLRAALERIAKVGDGELSWYDCHSVAMDALRGTAVEPSAERPQSIYEPCEHGVQLAFANCPKCRNEASQSKSKSHVCQHDDPSFCTDECFQSRTSGE